MDDRYSQRECKPVTVMAQLSVRRGHHWEIGRPRASWPPAPGSQHPG